MREGGGGGGQSHDPGETETGGAWNESTGNKSMIEGCTWRQRTTRLPSLNAGPLCLCTASSSTRYEVLSSYEHYSYVITQPLHQLPVLVPSVKSPATKQARIPSVMMA